MHTWELHHLLQDKFALGWENGQRTDFAEKSRTILYFLQQIFTIWIILLYDRFEHGK